MTDSQRVTWTAFAILMMFFFEYLSHVSVSPSSKYWLKILSLKNHVNQKRTRNLREGEESIFNGKTNKLNPPQRRPWKVKVSRQADCIMQNYQEPT